MMLTCSDTRVKLGLATLLLLVGSSAAFASGRGVTTRLAASAAAADMARDLGKAAAAGALASLLVAHAPSAEAISGGGLDFASTDIQNQDFSKKDYSKKDFSG